MYCLTVRLQTVYASPLNICMSTIFINLIRKVCRSVFTKMRLQGSLKKFPKSGLLILFVLLFLCLRVLYSYDFSRDYDHLPFTQKNHLFKSNSDQDEDDQVLPSSSNRIYKESISNYLNYQMEFDSTTMNPVINFPITDTDSSFAILIQEIINRFWTVVRGRKDYNISSKIFIPFQNPLSKGQLSSLNLWQSNYSSTLFEEDRIVAQLVFQADLTNYTSLKHNKLILVLDSSGYEFWGKSAWRTKTSNAELLSRSGYKTRHKASKGDKYIFSLNKECPSVPGSNGGYGGCIFTEDIGLADEADVILMSDIFHGDGQIVGISLKSKNVLKFTYILESPYNSKTITLTDKNDMLATYWSGSHLPTPYFKWVYFNPNVKAKPQGRDYSKGKSKPGAMFVSNCMPKNNRMGYIAELQKYIQVDVYGQCGTLSCSRFVNATACFELIKKDYYFYFSFENSNCRDYITEKFFINAFENDVVPIVMGAHPQDYRAMAPFHSYIHVEDFKSPQALADHLKFLISNPSEYNRYFEWKGTGRIIFGEFFCRLCALSHYADIVPPPKLFAKPFEWRPESQVTSRNVSSTMCLNYGNWYWTMRNSEDSD